MIAAGLPEDWSNATDRTAIRHNPPRTAAEIPSAKSDSLSWSVEEKREIDQALEAVWRPVVEKAPLPPPGKGPSRTVGLTPELVEPHHEQGVPYVVVHPARLYIAHPKWPTAACEPLDERAEHYCALDVARHTRHWMEAALRKGLVVFEAPGDAELYHPKDRDRWSQPLYSSHEATSNVCPSAREDETAGPVSPKLPQPATDTGHAKPAAAEEPSSPPAPEFPDSARTALEREWIRLWRAFEHDVHVATNSLLYLLDGVHSIHEGLRQRAIETMNASGGTIQTIEDAIGDVYPNPAYPRLRAFPALVSEPLFARPAAGGLMEQVVFKGWTAHMYDLWDSVYRNQLKHGTAARGLRGAIRPRQQVLGDFRHIRNNLLHSGIARKGDAANCEILRWFTEGERMVMRLSVSD